MMDRRQFLKSAVAVGVAASIPAFVVAGPYINSAYPPGDIRRYGAVSGRDCTVAFQAAIDAQTERDIGIYVPPGEWRTNGRINGVIRGRKIGIQFDA